MYNFELFKSFFDGKIKLWKAYWLVGEILNGLVLLIIFYIEINFLHTSSSVSQIPFLNFSNFTFLSKIIIFLWTIFISIGVWRSAENYEGNIIWIVITFIIISYRCYSLLLLLFI